MGKGGSGLCHEGQGSLCLLLVFTALEVGRGHYTCTKKPEDDVDVGAFLSCFPPFWFFEIGLLLTEPEAN